MMSKNKFYKYRSGNTHTLKETIDALLDQYRIRGKFNESKIIASWEKILGKPIAKRTDHIYIKSGTLFVKLSSAPLKKDLSMAKSRLIEMLNEETGTDTIKDIHFF